MFEKFHFSDILSLSMRTLLFRILEVPPSISAWIPSCLNEVFCGLFSYPKKMDTRQRTAFFYIITNFLFHNYHTIRGYK